VPLKYGSILYTAYGSFSSNTSGQTIASAVCVAIPQNNFISLWVYFATSEIQCILSNRGQNYAKKNIQKIFCDKVLDPFDYAN